jgi:cytoskeletal protein RodZ
MERIGERLRRRREELGLTIEDVSESIRYRPEVIRFIEEGRSSVFPAKAYLSAFLRAYAVILELDPQEIVREQKSEEERAFEAIRNIRVKPKRRKKFPRKPLYILVPIVLAVVLLIVVDRFLWERGEDIGPAPGELSSRAVMRPDAAAQDTIAESVGTGEADAAGEDTGGDEQGDPAGEPEDAGAADPGAGELPSRAVMRPDAAAQDTITESAGTGETGAAGEDTGDDEQGDPAGKPEDTGAADPALGETDAAGEDTGGDEQAREEAALAAASGPLRDDSGEDEVLPGDAVETAETEGRTDDGDATAPGVAEIEPMVPVAESEAPPAPRRQKLVVSARRGAYINLASGGRSVYDGYFGGGEVDSFFSETPFVIVALTDRGAWTFVQNGERVGLPGSSSEDVSNFVIPLPSDD